MPPEGCECLQRNKVGPELPHVLASRDLVYRWYLRMHCRVSSFIAQGLNRWIINDTRDYLLMLRTDIVARQIALENTQKKKVEDITQCDNGAMMLRRKGWWTPPVPALPASIGSTLLFLLWQKGISLKLLSLESWALSHYGLSIQSEYPRMCCRLSLLMYYLTARKYTNCTWTQGKGIKSVERTALG